MDPDTGNRLVSIIVPTYNRASTLVAALESVFRQDYRPIELIVVDDGSTDDTRTIVEGWRRAHEDEQFHVIYRRDTHRGAPAARNAGMRTATGAYLGFLDSDCSLAPDFITCLAETLRQYPGTPFAYGVTEFVNEDGDPVERVGCEPKADRYEDAVSQNMTCIAPLFRREAIDGIEWNEELVCMQDWAFKAVITIRHGVGVFVQDAVARALLHGGDRISRHGTAAFLTGQAFAIRFVHGRLPGLPSALPAQAVLGRRMLSVARGYMRLGQFPEARQTIREAAKLAAGHSGLVSVAAALTRIFGTRALAWAMKATGRL